MKTFAALLALALLASPGASLAQGGDEISVSQQDPEGDRRRLIEKNLEMSAAESAAFWPVYEEYRKAMVDVEEKRVAVIQKFAESYQELSDAKAQEMMNDYFGFRKAKVDLQTTYVKRFAAVLPAKKVMRYYQIENLIDTRIDFDLTRAIPLAK